MNRLKITLIEILLMASVGSLFVSVIVAGPSLVQEKKRLDVCARNLRSIGQAMYIYAQDGDVFPMMTGPRKQNDGAMVLFSKGSRTSQPASNAAPSPTCDLWMLVKANNMTPTSKEEFVCPLTKDAPDPAQDVSAYLDFLTAANLSYAYQYQHDPDAGVLGVYSNPVIPLMADANPYIKGGIKTALLEDRQSKAAGNSTNHGSRRPSQNVLFVDAHVSLETSPDVGVSHRTDSRLTKSRRRDNCYSVYEAGKPADPGASVPTSTKCNLADKSDACLVP